MDNKEDNMEKVEFHSQEWWVLRVQFWKDMISANSLIVTEIEGIVQKEWNDEQRVDIRTSREAVKHAQGNLIVAESKIKE
jgi:hypothetical protein